MKKTYIQPNIYSKKLVITHILAGSPTMDSNTTTTEQDAKQGTGFDWGDSWSNNEEPEN